MSIDIDIDKIAEDLNDKADIDMNNTVDHLGTAAKEFFSKIGFPSTRYTNLTLASTSPSSHTAPANGWVYVAWNEVTGTGGSSLDTENPTFATYSISTGWQRHFLPVQKGQIFKVYWSGTTRTLNTFRFFYAEGVK